MAVTVTISPDLDKVLASLSPEALAAERRGIMQRIVLTVESKAKEYTPVRTGTLRRSITGRVEGAGERGLVGTNVRYGPIVHQRRPFLEQGLSASEFEIERILQAAADRLAGGN